jgi:catechol 2,3-dioxygenase-like lactoylglutathione lyase family enzyme
VTYRYVAWGSSCWQATVGARRYELMEIQRMTRPQALIGNGFNPAAAGIDRQGQDRSRSMAVCLERGQHMKPRISVITICVDDLERSLRFYRDGLGLPTQGVIGAEFEHGAVAFFELQGGIALAIWPRQSVAYDTGIPVGPPSPTEFTLGHNVSSSEEVDAVMEQARDAGATIVKQAQDTFWGGYSGYFQDPDGHLWEVVWNPERLPED